MADNNTVLTFFEENIVKRESGEITDSVTTGKIYKAYKRWCEDNNNGYAKTNREFRDIISRKLGADYSDITVRRSEGIFYKTLTLSKECQEEYGPWY